MSGFLELVGEILRRGILVFQLLVKVVSGELEGLYFEVVYNFVSCFMVFGNCCYYQIGIVYDVVIGEDFWVVGLESIIVVFWCDNLFL